MIDLEFFDTAAAEQGETTVTVLDEEHELSIVEVEETLEKIREINRLIESKQAQYDAVAAYHQEKIERAKEICDKETAPYRTLLEEEKLHLRRFAEANITGKKRSLELPSGTLSFRKRQPIFYLDGVKVTGDNPELIELARNIDADLIKVKTTEAADWASLKKRLALDEAGNVYLEETGEVLAGMRAQILPDDFNIETA